MGRDKARRPQPHTSIEKEVAVTSHVIAGPLLEELRSLFLPVLERVDGRLPALLHEAFEDQISPFPSEVSR
ncbi:hypothetical protein, partial [Paracoccus rhizosphaerae]